MAPNQALRSASYNVGTVKLYSPSGCGNLAYFSPTATRVLGVNGGESIIEIAFGPTQIRYPQPLLSAKLRASLPAELPR
jgi:hypothetical protein